MKKTRNMFIKELRFINNSIIVTGDYTGARNKISVECKKCSYRWEATPTNLLRGRGCPKCALESKSLKRRKSESQFIEELKSINSSITLLSEYKNTNTKVLVKCRICNHRWDVLPSALLRGNGCPVCSRTGTSWVEQTILLCLESLTKDEVISRDRKTIGMELDIYIPSKKVAIEYGAWPWHKNKSERDNNKRILCNEKGIQLIQIFDAYDGKLKSNKYMWFYKENLGKKDNNYLVKDMIIRLCNAIDIPFTINDEEYDKILVDARLNSRKMTTEQLQEKVNKINPNLIILGQYHDALTKINVKCSDCGYIWDIVPASLLRGNNCPKCMYKVIGTKLRKNSFTFEKQLKEIHPEIKICEKYKGNHEKINVSCDNCGYNWNSTPGTLLRGNGCPVCYKEERREKNRIINEKEFIRKLSIINPNVSMIGKYVLSNKKVLMRCNVCNNEWLVVPSSLIQRKGCPECARRKRLLK